MNQWTQENVKFKVTINQWYLDTTTQWQQSHGVVASGIAAVDFAQSNGSREFCSCNKNNQLAAKARHAMFNSNHSSKSRTNYFYANNELGKWQQHQQHVRNSNTG